MLADLSNFPMLESNPAKMSGVPCFKGSRFTAAGFLAELAGTDTDSYSVKEVAEALYLDQKVCVEFLEALCVLFNQPVQNV